MLVQLDVSLRCPPATHQQVVNVLVVHLNVRYEDCVPAILVAELGLRIRHQRAAR